VLHRHLPCSISYKRPHTDPDAFPTRRSSDRPQGHGESRSCRPPREEVVACRPRILEDLEVVHGASSAPGCGCDGHRFRCPRTVEDRKSTRLNSSHVSISYAVFCSKKKTSRLR